MHSVLLVAMAFFHLAGASVLSDSAAQDTKNDAVPKEHAFPHLGRRTYKMGDRYVTFDNSKLPYLRSKTTKRKVEHNATFSFELTQVGNETVLDVPEVRYKLDVRTPLRLDLVRPSRARDDAPSVDSLGSVCDMEHIGEHDIIGRLAEVAMWDSLANTKRSRTMVIERFENSTTIPNGWYQVLLSAYKRNMAPVALDDWDRWISPLFQVDHGRGNGSESN